MIYNDELQHTGKLGMKWGKGKKEFGVSKLQLKKNINNSSKTEVKKTQSKYRDELNSNIVGKGLSRQEAGKAAKEVGKKYVNEFNNSLLKDLNYNDVKKGQKMLKYYGLNFKVDNQYGIVRKGALGNTMVYA